jgi:AcrR family transcriptional regulator
MRTLTKPPKTRRPRGAARAALIEAARLEFDEHGYDGTDSNRIARRAGYAPQTFYWHFADKAAVFAEVFTAFAAEDYAAMRTAMAAGGEAVAEAVIQLHQRRRLFRRSLRHLSVVDPHIRAVRQQTRRRQVEVLLEAVPGMEVADAVALLLASDRLADAAAEGELAELGIDKPAEVMARLWQRFGATLGVVGAIADKAP